MVRATEWRRQVYSVVEPESGTWVASQNIEFSEGETLAGVWISAHARTTAIVNAPIGAQGLLPINDLTSAPRIGLLWVDNPLTLVDPLSSLADPLWVSLIASDLRPVLIAKPNGLDPVVQDTQWMWSASYRQNPTKVEGMRRVAEGQGTRWLTLHGDETGTTNEEWHNRLVAQAVVSALVMLPEA